MLYDPKWEVKADPFSLENLIAWLEMQPARGAYNYCDPDNCMLCQYFTAMGFQGVSITFNEMEHSGGVTMFPREFHWEVANNGIDTFGAALERARALSASNKSGNN